MAHPLAHCYADSDAFPIRYTNSFGQPDVVADVHAYRNPETNLHDAVCYRYGDAGTDLHAFTHPGDTRPDRHVHGHIHAHTELHGNTNTNVDACHGNANAKFDACHGDTNTNVDACTDVDTSIDAIFYCYNGAYVTADADRIAQFHAPPHLNSHRDAGCHSYAVCHCRQLGRRSKASSRSGKRITLLHATKDAKAFLTTS